eukprot:g1019.t1
MSAPEEDSLTRGIRVWRRFVLGDGCAESEILAPEEQVVAYLRQKGLSQTDIDVIKERAQEESLAEIESLALQDLGSNRSSPGTALLGNLTPTQQSLSSNSSSSSSSSPSSMNKTATTSSTGLTVLQLANSYVSPLAVVGATFSTLFMVYRSLVLPFINQNIHYVEGQSHLNRQDATQNPYQTPSFVNGLQHQNQIPSHQNQTPSSSTISASKHQQSKVQSGRLSSQASQKGIIAADNQNLYKTQGSATAASSNVSISTPAPSSSKTMDILNSLSSQVKKLQESVEKISASTKKNNSVFTPSPLGTTTDETSRSVTEEGKDGTRTSSTGKELPDFFSPYSPDIDSIPTRRSNATNNNGMLSNGSIHPELQSIKKALCVVATQLGSPEIGESVAKELNLSPLDIQELITQASPSPPSSSNSSLSSSPKRIRLPKLPKPPKTPPQIGKRVHDEIFVDDKDGGFSLDESMDNNMDNPDKGKFPNPPVLTLALSRVSSSTSSKSSVSGLSKSSVSNLSKSSVSPDDVLVLEKSLGMKELSGLAQSLVVKTLIQFEENEKVRSLELDALVQEYYENVYRQIMDIVRGKALSSSSTLEDEKKDSEEEEGINTNDTTTSCVRSNGIAPLSNDLVEKTRDCCRVLVMYLTNLIVRGEQPRYRKLYATSRNFQTIRELGAEYYENLLSTLGFIHLNEGNYEWRGFQNLREMEETHHKEDTVVGQNVIECFVNYPWTAVTFTTPTSEINNEDERDSDKKIAKIEEEEEEEEETRSKQSNEAINLCLEIHHLSYMLSVFQHYSGQTSGQTSEMKNENDHKLEKGNEDRREEGNMNQLTRFDELFIMAISTEILKARVKLLEFHSGKSENNSTENVESDREKSITKLNNLVDKVMKSIEPYNEIWTRILDYLSTVRNCNRQKREKLVDNTALGTNTDTANDSNNQGKSKDTNESENDGKTKEGGQMSTGKDSLEEEEEEICIPEFIVRELSAVLKNPCTSEVRLLRMAKECIAKNLEDIQKTWDTLQKEEEEKKTNSRNKENVKEKTTETTETIDNTETIENTKTIETRKDVETTDEQGVQEKQIIKEKSEMEKEKNIDVKVKDNGERKVDNGMVATLSVVEDTHSGDKVQLKVNAHSLPEDREATLIDTQLALKLEQEGKAIPGVRNISTELSSDSQKWIGENTTNYYNKTINGQRNDHGNNLGEEASIALIKNDGQSPNERVVKGSSGNENARNETGGAGSLADILNLNATENYNKGGLTTVNTPSTGTPSTDKSTNISAGNSPKRTSANIISSSDQNEKLKLKPMDDETKGKGDPSIGSPEFHVPLISSTTMAPLVLNKKTISHLTPQAK